MRGVVISQWGPFSLTSYGRGILYTLRRKADGQSHSVVFQGDDASAFREELEDEENARPTVSALPEMWSRYGHVADPD